MSPCLLGPRQTARPEKVVSADTREGGRPAPHRRASSQRAHEVGSVQENLQKQQDPSEGGWFPPRGQGHLGSQSTEVGNMGVRNTTSAHCPWMFFRKQIGPDM